MNSKYENIYKSITAMLAPLKKDRPDCEKLLADKKLWALDIFEIENDPLIVNINNYVTEKASIKQNFFDYFVRTKLTLR
jgi:UDP:flavonoid glycosyltransferase YjiC (YdhE family)